MGGTPWNYTFLSRLQHQHDICFVIAGGDSGTNLHNQGNLLVLDTNSGIYHPDLITAADVVIGKVGYSTLAEVYQAGVPFGYIARSHFRESEVLTRYIAENMPGLAVTEEEFLNGSWLTGKLPALLETTRPGRAASNGAGQIAPFITSLLQTL
jgi:predicted glycosyltransferase